MASKKDLKKEINYISAYYLGDLMILQEIAPEAQQQEIEQVKEDLICLADDTIAHISGSKNAEGCKKQYFNNLIADYDARLDKIVEQIQKIYGDIAKEDVASEEAPVKA